MWILMRDQIKTNILSQLIYKIGKRWAFQLKLIIIDTWISRQRIFYLEGKIKK